MRHGQPTFRPDILVIRESVIGETGFRSFNNSMCERVLNVVITCECVNVRLQHLTVTVAGWYLTTPVCLCVSVCSSVGGIDECPAV